jgi:hypothetical protein
MNTPPLTLPDLTGKVALITGAGCFSPPILKFPSERWV